MVMTCDSSTDSRRCDRDKREKSIFTGSCAEASVSDTRLDNDRRQRTHAPSQQLSVLPRQTFHCHINNTPLQGAAIATSVDLRAAFDSLSRPALWLLLTTLGTPKQDCETL